MDLREVNLRKYRHPCEIARVGSIIGMLEKNARDIQYADVGAGDLFFTSVLKKYTDKPIYAVDINYKDEIKNDWFIKCIQISEIPSNSIDYITLMDVLEHVEDENIFLRSLKGLLKNKGRILITVPAYQFLFSGHDIFLKHFRRYSRKQLEQLLAANHFEIEESFYFFTTLVFIRFLEVIFFKLNLRPFGKGNITGWNFGENSIFTILVAKILSVDFLLNKYLSKLGLRFTGLSICIICGKKLI